MFNDFICFRMLKTFLKNVRKMQRQQPSIFKQSFAMTTNNPSFHIDMSRDESSPVMNITYQKHMGWVCQNAGNDLLYTQTRSLDPDCKEAPSVFWRWISRKTLPPFSLIFKKPENNNAQQNQLIKKMIKPSKNHTKTHLNSTKTLQIPPRTHKKTHQHSISPTCACSIPLRLNSNSAAASAPGATCGASMGTCGARADLGSSSCFSLGPLLFGGF